MPAKPRGSSRAAAPPGWLYATRLGEILAAEIDRARLITMVLCHYLDPQFGQLASGQEHQPFDLPALDKIDRFVLLAPGVDSGVFRKLDRAALLGLLAQRHTCGNRPRKKNP